MKVRTRHKFSFLWFVLFLAFTRFVSELQWEQMLPTKKKITRIEREIALFKGCNCFCNGVKLSQSKYYNFFSALWFL